MVNEIVTVMTVTGEYVGKLVNVSEDFIELSDPRLIVTTENGMGFASGIAMTGSEKPSLARFKDYVFMTETNEQVVSAWREHTSGIVTSSQGLFGAN